MSKLTREQEKVILQALQEDVKSTSKMYEILCEQSYGCNGSHARYVKNAIIIALVENGHKEIADLDFSYEIVEEPVKTDGEKFYGVMHFQAIELYIKFDGYYSSWGDSELNDVEIVFPHVVSITTYKAAPQAYEAVQEDSQQMLSEWLTLYGAHKPA